MPPAKIMMRPPFETWIPKNWSLDWLFSPKSFVVMSKALEVNALLIEISMT
jgi:hypothetical protein